jgi:polysaccharide biosynthesis protein PslH
MTSKPRLLFLAQTLPYPPDSGVQIRTYNILRLLSRQYDVHALCFYRAASHPTDEYVRRSLRALGQLASVEAFPIPQEHSRVRLVRDHMKSVLTRRVYTVAAYESQRFERRLCELLDEHSFDLIHMDSLDLSGYLPRLVVLPVVCVHHNVESKLLHRRADQEPPARGLYLRLQARMMENEERRWSPAIDLNITVSPRDADDLQEIAPGSEVVVVPNGVDTTAFEPGEESGGGIVFVGGYTWFPNRDALDYFAQDILPLIRQERPDVAVHWVGQAPEGVRERYTGLGITLTGYVPDIRPYVIPATCYVVPLRAGGGTRLKILDAWAMGKALVSTSVGCEGLEARDGDNILVRDDPAAFADAVLRLLRDEGLRKKLEYRARETACRFYDWNVIGRDMLAAYRRLTKG